MCVYVCVCRGVYTFICICFMCLCTYVLCVCVIYMWGYMCACGMWCVFVCVLYVYGWVGVSNECFVCGEMGMCGQCGGCASVLHTGVCAILNGF